MPTAVAALWLVCLFGGTTAVAAGYPAGGMTLFSVGVFATGWLAGLAYGRDETRPDPFTLTPRARAFLARYARARDLPVAQAFGDALAAGVFTRLVADGYLPESVQAFAETFSRPEGPDWALLVHHDPEPDYGDEE